MSTRSARPILLGSVPKHLHVFAWLRANTGRAQRPVRLSADHQALRGPLSPGPAHSTIRRSSDQAPCLLPDPPSKCLPDPLQFAPGAHNLSRPLPVDEGNRSIGATKRIPTKLQEEKGLSRRRGVVRVPQEAVISRNTAGILKASELILSRVRVPDPATRRLKRRLVRNLGGAWPKLRPKAEVTLQGGRGPIGPLQGGASAPGRSVALEERGVAWPGSNRGPLAAQGRAYWE